MPRPVHMVVAHCANQSLLPTGRPVHEVLITISCLISDLIHNLIMPGDGHIPPTGDHPRLNKPLHEERPLKVICIGAGASGLLLAYKLQRSFERFELVLYEKNDGVSGTWYENNYPG